MDVDKKWMLMTYYCPTHGDSGIHRADEMTKKKLANHFSKKERHLKINY